jgi:sugar/nucleoside kinase (ribokinase family)
MHPRIDALVAGHICLDFHPDLTGAGREPFAETFQPGRLISTGAAHFSTGGAVSNTGLALHRLGISTQLAGKLGADLFGQAVLQILREHGSSLADGMQIDASAKTSYTVLINYPGVDRIFLHHPGANDTFGAQDVPYERLAGARLFHFGYPPLMHNLYQEDGKQLADIFQRAKQTGVTTSLDMAYPDPASQAGKANWRKILARSLPWVDIFLPSLEEILLMLRPQVYYRLREGNILAQVTPDLLTDLSTELLDWGAKIVAFKLGERGLYLRTAPMLTDLGRGAPADLAFWQGREFWSPCFRVQVVGTTGAGDATIAGFLAAFLRGASPQEALTAAVAVGACNVEAADALSGIQSWGTTLARIAGGWQRHSLPITAPGWEFLPEWGLWQRKA